MANAKQGIISEGRKRSLANLAPPWPKGVSGNPRGRKKRVDRALVPAILTQLRKQTAEHLANYDQLTPGNQELAHRWAAVLLYVTDAPANLAASVPIIR